MITLLKALPMNTGMNFRASEALRTASYSQKTIKRKLLQKQNSERGGKGEVILKTSFHTSLYLKTHISKEKIGSS